MAVEYLGKGSDDGTSLGSATTEKVSLYGVTPIVQRSGAAQATLTLTTIATADSGWMFKTSDGFNALFAQVTEIRNALVAIGVIKGSS
jgi:hypothetical protein